VWRLRARINGGLRPKSNGAGLAVGARVTSADSGIDRCVQETLSRGFVRQRVVGWSAGEAAWLIETTHATMAERMCALSPQDAARWVERASVEVSPDLERDLEASEVLVLVARAAAMPVFAAAPEATNLFDLLPPEAARRTSDAGEEQDLRTDFIEVQVVDARGRPRPSVRYQLHFPNGTQVTGVTDADGMLRHERLEQSGEAVLILPDVEAEAA
jgi:hypothetical protein